MRTNRATLADISIGGTTIPAGSSLALVHAAGNRDPRRFAEPDCFDPDRADNQHISFNSGIHYCFGAPLARVQVQVALAALLRSYPGLELADAGGQVRRVPDPATWRLAALPVRLGQPCRASS